MYPRGTKASQYPKGQRILDGGILVNSKSHKEVPNTDRGLTVLWILCSRFSPKVNLLFFGTQFHEVVTKRALRSSVVFFSIAHVAVPKILLGSKKKTHLPFTTF